MNKIQNLLQILILIQGGIWMIPPHNIYQIYHSLSVRDDCTPPKCGERVIGMETDNMQPEFDSDDDNDD